MMMSIRPESPEFHKGDEVVLAEGPYQGTHGVFLRLRQDGTWADITEPMEASAATLWCGSPISRMRCEVSSIEPKSHQKRMKWNHNERPSE